MEPDAGEPRLFPAHDAVHALDDLVVLTEELFTAVPIEIESWAGRVVDRLIDYFAERALLYRAAIARFPESGEMRLAYRNAEVRAVAAVTAALRPDRDPDDAVAVVIFAQGINNPALLRSEPGSRVRRRLAVALASLVADGHR